MKTENMNKFLEDNKLIAEFMEVKNVFEYSFDENNKVLYIAEDNEGSIDWIDVGLNTIEYHCSWDWLMSVVEKIREKVNSLNIASYRGEDMSMTIFMNGEDEPIYNKGVSALNVVYQSVVEFIKWYNNKEKS